MPCGSCNDLRSNSQGIENRRVVFRLELNAPLEDFERTAKDGCEACRVILKGISGFQGNRVRVIGERNLASGYHSLVVNFAQRISHNEGDTCPWPMIPARKWPIHERTVDDCVRFIRHFELKCKAFHVVCGALASIGTKEHQPYVPTRLVHVGSADEQPRVVETKDLRGDELRNAGVYTALSHCWGPHQLIDTKLESLDDRKAGIPWDQLSKTFQHALIITRALGVQYIWIDSLCIIQDSPSDWATEASQMANVYGSARLTIAATSASSGQDGFLYLPKSPVVEVESTQSGQSCTVYFSPMFVLNAFYRPLTYRDKDFPLPLLGRGWCLQEELLSRRVVHFTPDDLIWQCFDELACECHEADNYKFPALKYRFGSALRDSSLRAETWRLLLEQYCSRQLTYQEDRLPALSGVASRFEGTGGRYLAGHWEEDLPFSLLWVDKHGPGERIEPVVDRESGAVLSKPPTWSWASIKTNGVLSWQRWKKDARSQVQIESITYHPTTTDPRGLVAGGTIQVTGKLYPLEQKQSLPYNPGFFGERLYQPARPDVTGQIVCQEDIHIETIHDDLESGSIYYLLLTSVPGDDGRAANDGLYILSSTKATLEALHSARLVISATRIGVGSLLDGADMDGFVTGTVLLS